MWRSLVALVGALSLAACGEHAQNAYPQSAKAQFEASCPAASAVCTCTWDKITRDLTYEEYQESLSHFRETGLMEPRITHARTFCIEHNPE